MLGYGKGSKIILSEKFVLNFFVLTGNPSGPLCPFGPFGPGSPGSVFYKNIRRHPKSMKVNEYNNIEY